MKPLLLWIIELGFDFFINGMEMKTIKCSGSRAGCPTNIASEIRFRHLAKISSQHKGRKPSEFQESDNDCYKESVNPFCREEHKFFNAQIWKHQSHKARNCRVWPFCRWVTERIHGISIFCTSNSFQILLQDFFIVLHSSQSPFSLCQYRPWHFDILKDGWFVEQVMWERMRCNRKIFGLKLKQNL